MKAEEQYGYSGINVKVIGRCGLCGGRVVIPLYYHSMVIPEPKCEKCGAVADINGPIIPMARYPKKVIQTGLG